MKWRSLEESTPGADTRTLREQLAERKELIARYVPAEIQAIHARVVADLKATGVAENVLRVGAQAPAFELKDHNGKLVSSAGLLAKGRLVVFFLRGRWDPFCCGQAEAMNQLLPRILEAGASAVVAISPQTVQQSYFMADQHKLRFPLLSDAGNQVARRFGLSYRVPDEQQAIYRRAFVNLPLANGDESWELPIPATYILDRDGRVRYASADPDYMERPEPEEILAHLS
ncbi:MAG TPA: peroxiredoxin-like family protein [Terriglobales bacterium]|nr:peroxiredoxin-like family protein [Terriglobales bacterium]